MAKKTLDEVYANYFRQPVEDGGGIFVGIQECEGRNYDLVLFNSPTTGSTLALKTDRITSHAVWNRIHESDKTFKARGNE